MMQPVATSGAVAKPNSSAPSSAGEHDVTARAHLPVRLQEHAAAQIIFDQHLVGFGQPDFPRDARVLDRGEGRGARTAVVAGDQDHVGVRLGHTCSDRADAGFSHQLHADARLRIDHLQVEDQLRQILDRVDVVMRRR